LNIRDLEYLVAVDELKHFRKAAEKCFVSQPTLSGQIKKLEEDLGVELFERSKHKIILTDTGKKIIERARIILAEVKHIEDLARTATDPMSGKLNIGIIPTIAPFLLPLIIKVMKKEFPRLEPLLHEIQTATIIEKLDKGEIDLGILALPIEDSNLIQLSLFKEPFFMAVSGEHKLSSKKTVTLQDLRNETVLLLEDGHCLGRQALDICYTAGAKEMENFRATSMETLRHMLLVENVITLIPQLAVNHYKKLKEEYIKYIPFENPKPQRNVGLVYRKTSGREEAFVKTGELIKRVALENL
jgi:LysR family hydrogen peroxide-inducible transcriptional activator